MPLHGEIVVIKRNGSDGTHFPLTAKSCLFGRKAECDIRIQLPHVSKEHCKVDVKDKGEVFVTNLSTVNPTQINGTTFKQPVRLKHGDVITIIDRSFRFEKPSAQQGKRRSTGLDSETFKAFASNQSSDTNETVRIESVLTSKTQRKSEGSITRTTHSRRSLQISSSSEPRRDMSPFGELYEMLKSEVKQNGKTPVKDKSRSPKNVALKRSLQIQDNAQTPVAPKRTPRRSQSSDSPKTSPKEVVVERRSASAGRVREASKSPSRSPKTSIKAANESFQGESEQTKRRSSGKQDSQSVHQEQVVPVVNGSIQKRSPRRSAGAEQSQALTQIQSTPKNVKTPDTTPRRRSNQSVPEQLVLKEASPRSKSPTQGRRSASLENVQKGTPNKPPVTEGKTEGPRQSPRKRRSDELSLPDPPPKRKRVSFGGHLSPELFDKRLPPNSPLKKGATPARRSLSLNSPHTLIRKSFGPKQSVIREVFERSASANVTPSTPASASQSSPSKYSVKSSPAVTESGKSQVSKSPNKPSALIKTPARSPSPRRPVSAKSPDVSQSTAPITPLKNSPAKSGVKTPSTSSKRTSGQKSLSVNSPVKSPSKSPKKTPSKSPKGLAIKSTTPVKTPSPGAKRSPVAKTPSPAKKTPVAKTPSPAKRAKTPSPTKRSKTPSPARKTPMAKTPSPAKKSPVAKTPSPAKKTPVAKTPSPAKKTPVAKTSTPAKRSKTPSPAKKTPVAKMPSPAKKTPVAKMPSPAKKTPVAKTPSPAKTPVAKTPSPAKTPVAKTPSPAKKTPVAKTPSPAKKTPVAKTSTPAKRSKTPSPAKKTPVTKTSTPAKRSKTPSPAKKTPVAKTPSPAKRSKTPSPAKKTPVTKTSTPAKRSKTPSPAKKTPVTKTSTPAKRSKTLSPAKKTQVAKTPSPAKRSKTPSPAKKTPVAKTPSPAKRSKTPSPAKKKPVAKTPTPAKRSKTPSPAKKTPVAKTPTQAKRSTGAKTPTPTTPATPYMKGRFSVSRIDTPPQETVQSELPPSRTPNKSRKSLSMKTPRRSRKLEALELIRSRRRSGATEANLLVSRTWADVVKIGVAKSQKKIEEKPVWKTVATKKKLKHKTPMKKIKDLASTGHADSPATILVGRAHTRTMNLTGYVPKVVRNQAVKLDTALNESFTGVAELFSTPVNKQRKSNRVESSKNDTPSSTVVEVSAMQTPEGSGEMVVSPLNSTNTTRRKQYGQDAVSRLLHSPVSPELLKEDSATLELTKEASKSQKNERKSVGLSAVKRIMRTPKQKGGLVTDPHALRKLLRTPKETESPRASSRRSANLEVLGINRLVKTPKQKGVPVENFSALQRIMKTPKQKAEPVEVLTAVKRIMRTPKERVQPVEDMIGVKRVMRTPKEKSQPVEDLVGIKRIMRSPKERGQPVEDMVGIKRIMSTPKERGQPVEDYALNHLMKTPEENVHSAESTRPIEEIFGMRNLIKTPPKPPAGKEVASTDPSKWSANSSGKAGRRGRPSKRLDLHIDSSSGATPETVQSSIVQEVTQSSQEVVKSVQKRGRPSKSQSVSSSELPNEHVVSDIVTSPRRRGRPSSASKGSLSASEAEVTSPTQRGKQIAVTESPKGSVPVADDKVTSPTRKGRVSTPAAAPKESASDAIVEVTPRRKGRQSSIAKESVSTSDTEVTSLAEPESLKITAEASKESASDAVREVTSPRRRGRQSSNSKAPEQPLSASYVDVSSPSRRGRPSSTAKESVSDSEVTSSTQPKTPKALAEAPKESASNSVSEVISPRRRGRPSSTATEEALSASAAEVTSPRLKGRQSSAARQSLSVSDTEVSSSTQPETPNNMAETSKEFTSNAVIEVTSPRRSGRPSSIAKAPKESLAASDAEVTSPSRRGRPSSSAEVPKSPVIADGQKTPPIHKKISKSKVASPEESVTVADSSNSEVVSPRSRGRQSSTGKAENPKETVPIADGKVTSPTRRGRPSASAVITESVPSTSPKIVEVLVESLPVSETASPARRGRPKKDRAVVPEESVPNAKSKLTSPTRNKPNSPSGDPSEPVSDSHSGITKDPIPVVEGKAASQTRRGRQKTKVDLPEEPPVPEVQITRGSRSKRTVEKSEQSVAAVDELPITQTRRGRPKASAQVSKAPPTVPEVDVSSPTRGSRSKEIAEAPKDTVPVLNDVAVSQKRRGRQKVAEVAVESAIVSEVAAPTRSSRSKDTANASEVSVPAVGEAQKRRGRLRKADVSKESGAVPEVTSSVEKLDPKSTDVVSEVASPTRKGRSRNAEVSKETEPVSHSVTSPKRRKSETTEAEVVLPEAPSEGANEKAAKSSKKTVRQSAKTPSKQAPEPEETLPVAEKKTQLPQRGRRKAAQNEPVVPEGDPNSSSEDKQPEGSTGNASPVARRGGRRRNAEELSSDEPVTKPKTSKQETRRRGQSKSKGLTEENVLENSDSSAPEEPVKSPEPKSPKKSPARQAKDLAIELPVESQPKSLRGRPGKKVNVTEESNVASSETVEPETEAPQKRVPARGRSRTAKDVVNVSASDAGEQTKGSSRASRRNQTLPEDSSESTEEQNKSVSEKESSARGKRGKKAPDSSEPHSSPEVKGRIAKGRVLKNVEEQTITKSKTKSVQWHPLLDTDIQSTTNTAQDSNEGSPRASRLKGKTRPDASEPQVTAKRSRRGNQAEAVEPPASTNPEPLTVSEDVPAKRGRKANVQKKGEAIDTKATAESMVSTEVVQAIPQRGRRGAPSKAVEIENHNVEPSTSRRQRGVAAKGTPSEENKSTQSPVKSQKGGAGQEKAEEVSSKSTRGVKRKQPNAEVKSAPVSEPDTPSQTSESVLVETENIPAGRGRKNQRNTKTQKVQEALPEKQTVTAESPAKRRKTEAATTAAQKKSSRQTSKLENEKPPAATKTRASTRSRK